MKQYVGKWMDGKLAGNAQQYIIKCNLLIINEAFKMRKKDKVGSAIQCLNNLCAYS